MKSLVCERSQLLENIATEQTIGIDLIGEGNCGGIWHLKQPRIERYVTLSVVGTPTASTEPCRLLSAAI